MTKQETKETFRALRALKKDSPMTKTMVFKRFKGDKRVVSSTCWDIGCTLPVCILQVIKKLDDEILPLTQDLIIVEASETELQILGTAVILLEADVLGPSKKQMEEAVTKGQDDNKELLVSLKLMKLWDVVHMTTVPKENVTSHVLGMKESNKLD